LNTLFARALEGNKLDIQYYHKNYLDHVMAVSDDNGNLIEHYRYTAFGEPEIYAPNGTKLADTAIDNDILWNVRRYEPATGLYLYKYRDYDSVSGRWPSRDPIGEEGGVNLYNVVSNNILNTFDVFGLQNTNSTDGANEVCYCGPDMSEWLTEELNLHASAFRGNMQKAGHTWRIMIVKAFGANVPYKWMNFNTPNCPISDKCKDTVMICGKCIHKSEMGNILFAAMARMIITEYGVNMGVSKIGDNGPDKPEDMAGIFGGYHLTPDLKKGNINQMKLCELLNSDSTKYFSGLDEIPALTKHKENLTNNSLNDMAAKYGICKKCPDKAPDLPHSDMTKVTNPPDGVGVLISEKVWKQVFNDMEVDWPK